MPDRNDENWSDEVASSDHFFLCLHPADHTLINLAIIFATVFLDPKSYEKDCITRS
jgi:hypothetical protein